MIKDLYIILAVGFVLKLYECVRRINNNEKKYNIIGFLDDNLDALKGIKCNLSVVGTISEYIPNENDIVVLGISTPSVKRIIVEKLKLKGAKFETIVSPEAIVGDFVEFGEGSVVMTPYNIETGSVIGKFVTVLGSTLAMDGIIGDYSTSTGFVNLGNSKIGSDVYIGTHVALLNGISVGNKSEISAGSIVMKDVPENVIMYGYPARVLKTKS